MKVLERHVTYGPFLERLRSAPARMLLLDYDGTLAPFVVDRTLALPYPEVPPLIVRIMAQGTRVVLISGRPVRELLLLSGISPQPEVWGSHGLERLMADGRYEVSSVPAHQDYLVAAATLLRDAGLERQMEVKPGGVAVHWRGLDPGKAEKVAKEAVSGAAVAYLGDDQTDEDAFHALKGTGLTVLVRPQSRPTAADVWLQPPHELILFLQEWLRASGGQG